MMDVIDRPRPDVDDLSETLASATLQQRLALLVEASRHRAVFTTSFGLEDQVLADAILSGGHGIDLVTLDTGRLFPETLDLWAETEARYGVRITGVAPDGPATEALLESQGTFGFRRSIAARTACCGVRKLEPLGRALASADVWVTGLRAGRSANRARTPFAEIDPARGLLKVAPLADWTRDRIETYARERGVPVNPLHARGFPSIGCAPCTRAVAPGEPERAGRWWWEQGRKECGLHDRPPLPVPGVADVTRAGR